MAKRGENDGNDLFGEGEDRRRRSDKLSALYLFLRRAGKEPDDPTITNAALDDGTYPMLAQREANFRYYNPQTAKWRNDRTADGKRNLYRTPDKGNLPFHECTQKQLCFDLWDKIENGEEIRDNLRRDITNFVIAFKGTTPVGPNGESIPKWIWGDDDQDYWNGMYRSKPSQPTPPSQPAVTA